jgi:hypothetical protein
VVPAGEENEDENDDDDDDDDDSMGSPDSDVDEYLVLSSDDDGGGRDDPYSVATVAGLWCGPRGRTSGEDEVEGGRVGVSSSNGGDSTGVYGAAGSSSRAVGSSRAGAGLLRSVLMAECVGKIEKSSAAKLLWRKRFLRRYRYRRGSRWAGGGGGGGGCRSQKEEEEEDDHGEQLWRFHLRAALLETPGQPVRALEQVEVRAWPVLSSPPESCVSVWLARVRGCVEWSVAVAGVVARCVLQLPM